MITRLFEYVGNGSNKFWEVSYPDWSVDRGVRTWSCRWGRNGTDGQTKTFTEITQSHAQDAALAKIDEKVRKGYVERGMAARRQVNAVSAIRQFGEALNQASEAMSSMRAA